MYYPSISSEFQKDQPSVHAISSAPPQPPFSNLEDTVATGIPVPFANQNSSSDSSRPPLPSKNANNNISLSPGPGPWSTGLCDCFSDLNTCCLTFWCPCVAFGRIAEIVDRGSTSCGMSGTLYTLIMCLTGCSCMYSCFYRSKLRGQYFLEESPCTDCCVHCFCEECALCQEYRELKNRGFDLSIGWHGSMERQKRLAATAPPTEERMTR